LYQDLGTQQGIDVVGQLNSDQSAQASQNTANLPTVPFELLSHTLKVSAVVDNMKIWLLTSVSQTQDFEATKETPGKFLCIERCTDVACCG
jgi:hypothetical protein